MLSKNKSQSLRVAFDKQHPGAQGSKKISVVITTHNYARFLTECIESVLRQDYSNYELIVVDDGSTDDTQSVLEKYMGVIVAQLTLDGEGVGSATSKGVRCSTGEYVMRLDADDYLAEGMLEKLSLVLDDDDSVGMVYPNYYVVDEAGTILAECDYEGQAVDSLHSESVPLGACALFRRECFDALNGCDETLRYEEDYDFWHRFKRKYRMANVNSPLFYYRRHGSNKSSRAMEKRESRRYVKAKLVRHLDLPGEQIVVLISLPVKSRRDGTQSIIQAAAELESVAVVYVVKEKSLSSSERISDGEKVIYHVVPSNWIKHDIEGLISNWLEHYKDICNDFSAVVAIDLSKADIHKDDIEEAINNFVLFDCDVIIGVKMLESPMSGKMSGTVRRPSFAVKAGTTDLCSYIDSGAFRLVRMRCLMNHDGRARSNRESHILISEN